jgi:hypothetical protein
MTERHASPLGRYDDEDTRADETVHTVRLVAVPVLILDAGRRHHQELMHEFSLLAVAENLTDDVPQRMLDLIDTLGRRYPETGDQPNAQVDAALARGDKTVDLTYEVAEHVVDAADRLEALLAEADEFCNREQMLTLQRTDRVKQFSTWYLDEFRRQIRGEPPRPWEGPLEP